MGNEKTPAPLRASHPMKLRRPSAWWLPLILPAGLAWGSLFGCLTAQIVAREAAAPLYQDARAPVEARVADLLPRLTLEEKVALCHGGFVSGGVPRLEISPLLMLDGRQGLRPMDRKDLRTTLLPCPLTLSCAWDETAAQEFGRVLAEGMLALGHHVLLAPMLNLMRSPTAGRNFENFGEDPFLTGRIGAAYIQGVQQLGVGACACLVVANGPVMLDPWGEKVPAILALHYAGQAMGEALADVLTGRVNPSGKLSYTFGRRLEDFAAHAVGAWPARLIRKVEPVNPGATPGERKAVHGFDADYKEGVFAGYRWFDQQKIEPWYPFGHGLSYTTFALRDLQVTEVAGGWSVSCEVRNTGDRAGVEVVQVYVAPPRSSVPRPPRELKGFAKVRLEPGEAKRIEIKLRLSALAFYDVTTRKWKAEAGEYSIQVGNSSRNLPLQCPVVLRQDHFHDRY